MVIVNYIEDDILFLEMRTIKRPIVSALIFSKDNNLLMGKKDPISGGVYSEYWHIPGGGIDEGESKIQALIREVKEEVGIDISHDEFELISNEGTGTAEKTIKETGEKVLVEMQFNVYKIILDKDSNEVKVILNDDLVEYKWFDLSELGATKITPPSLVLFKKLGYL